MAVFITGGQARELYDEHTLLLLHGEDIVDSSMYGLEVSNSGVTVSGDQSKFGGKSLYFNGAASLVIFSPEFTDPNGDLTIDWWQYRQNNGTILCYNQLNDTGFSQFLLQHTNGANCYGSYNGTTWDVFSGVAGFTNVQNQWVHCALVKSGATITMYQNGVKTWSGSATGTFSGGQYCVIIGRHAASSNYDYFKGYVDEFRISNVARWTSDFTPPDKPYSGGVSSCGGGTGETPCTVTITPAAGLTNVSAYGYVEINGTAYTNGTVTVAPGTMAKVYAYCASGWGGYIDLNGVRVVSGSTSENKWLVYDLPITANTSVSIGAFGTGGLVAITTT